MSEYFEDCINKHTSGLFYLENVVITNLGYILLSLKRFLCGIFQLLSGTFPLSLNFLQSQEGTVIMLEVNC